MFYWLDNFIQCLPPFFYQGVSSTSTSCIVFLTFYVDLTKWPDGLVRHGQHAGVSFLRAMPGLVGPCRVVVWCEFKPHLLHRFFNNLR
jgi:hypothetical protein